MQTAGGHMQRLRAPNNQKLYAKRARAVTSFKAARVYASMSLRPIGITKVGAQLRDAHCEGTLGTRLNLTTSHQSLETRDAQTRHQTHATIDPKRQNLNLTGYCAMKCSSRLIRRDLDQNVHN